MRCRSLYNHAVGNINELKLQLKQIPLPPQYLQTANYTIFEVHLLLLLHGGHKIVGAGTQPH